SRSGSLRFVQLARLWNHFWNRLAAHRLPDPFVGLLAVEPLDIDLRRGGLLVPLRDSWSTSSAGRADRVSARPVREKAHRRRPSTLSLAHSHHRPRLQAAGGASNVHAHRTGADASQSAWPANPAE